MMLVTQQRVGEDTGHIRSEAPLTWQYLEDHAQFFARRGSSIYRNKPPFSIFGVGAYSFTPWKIAISGFYKNLRFLRIGPSVGVSVVFDDTVNFLSCSSEEEANLLYELLTSGEAADFYNSMINWDEKRPITVDLLRRLSIEKLATQLGRRDEYVRFTTAQHGPLFGAVSQNAA